MAPKTTRDHADLTSRIKARTGRLSGNGLDLPAGPKPTRRLRRKTPQDATQSADDRRRMRQRLWAVKKRKLRKEQMHVLGEKSFRFRRSFVLFQISYRAAHPRTNQTFAQRRKDEARVWKSLSQAEKETWSKKSRD